MLERSKKTHEGEKEVESGEVTLEELERQIQTYRSFIEQRTAELNAKVEKLRKDIEGQKRPPSAGH